MEYDTLPDGVGNINEEPVGSVSRLCGHPQHIMLIAVTSTSRPIDNVPRVRLNQAYVDALESVGLVPLVVPPLAHPEAAAEVLAPAAGLVLTGGEDMAPQHYGAAPHERTGTPHPRRDATEVALTREASRRRLPTLAICRGLQVVNVALGGSLIQDLPSERPGAIAHDGGPRDARVHTVRIEEATRLAAVLGTTCLTTNSSHHQAIDRLAPGLRVGARADDGVIEGVEPEDTAWWMIAVQWHPEELTATPEAWDRALFAAFAAAARSR